MANIIKGILITPNKKGTEPKIYNFEYDNYQDFYTLLDCDIFGIQNRNFNGINADFYCDAEALLKDNNNNQPSIITMKGKDVVEVIVGSVFICKHDEEGETISLTDEECEKILATVKTVGLVDKKTVLVANL